MKSEEVWILPIIIGIGSPPFQVKVTSLKTEAADRSIVLDIESTSYKGGDVYIGS